MRIEIKNWFGMVVSLCVAALVTGGCSVMSETESVENSEPKPYTIPAVYNYLEDTNNNGSYNYPSEYKGLRKGEKKVFRAHEEIGIGLVAQHMVGAKVKCKIYNAKGETISEIEDHARWNEQVMHQKFGPGEFFDKYGGGTFTVIWEINNMRAATIGFDIIK